MQTEDEGSWSHLEDNKTMNANYAHVSMLANSTIIGDLSQYHSIKHIFKQPKHKRDFHLLVSLLTLILLSL